MPGRAGTTSRRSRSPTARAWRARCSSGSTSPRRSPGSTTGRWSGSTTSRATSTRRGCATRARRTAPEPVFPLVALVVSGGHTFLAEMRDHLTYRLLGTTLDDAAGEAFDKVGRLLGLGYPGGPAIGRAAEAATSRDRVFPRAWLGDSYDLSFSGLKTAARRIIAEARADAGLTDTPEAPLPDDVVAELAWGFQDAVVDVLVTKTIRAAEETGARSIVLGGGVAANSALRARLAGEAEARGLPLIVPRPALCTDNGAMIGAAGARRFAAGERAGLDLDARPSLPLAAPMSRVHRAAGRPGRRPGHAARGRASAPATRCRRTSWPTPTCSMRILAEADPPPGRRVLEIGPGLGLLTGGLLVGRRAVTAVELDRGLAAFLRERFEGGRVAPPHRGRRPRPGPRPPRRAAVRRRRQPAVPHHQPDPPRAARLAAPPGAARPDGPARGRRADRGAAREDELPVGLRPVPRPRPDRVHASRRRPSSPSRRSNPRSSSSSRTPPTTGSTRRPRTSCGAWSRPPSASGAR